MDALAVAHLVTALASVYAAVGALFALWFVWRGVERVDPHARGATLGFRAIILPGVVLFWPWLLRRWLAGRGEPPVERNAHRHAARADDLASASR